MAKAKKETESETIEQMEAVEEAVVESRADVPQLDNTKMAAITGFGLAIVVVIVMIASGNDGSEVFAASNVDSASPAAASSSPSASAPVRFASTSDDDIERKGEGRHFYTTIKIPAGAETLYLSGSGASAKEDGTMGSMEEQTRNTFEKFQATLEAEGWSMSDIVQVRAFAVAGEDGLLDFDGFNIAYREFFGSEENPMKPVRSFVQIAGLVVPGWLIEIEIRAAKMP